MSDQRAAVCFTCGQPSGDILRLNYLPSGKVCPACRDRLLEGIPGALPSGGDTVQEPSQPLSSLQESEAEPVPVRLSAQKGPGRLIQGDGPVEPA